MMRRISIVLAAVLALAGCGEQSSSQQAMPAQTILAEQKVQAEAASAPGSPASPTTGATFIAYSYRLAFELPARRLDAVQRAHAAACEAMGPARCQLLNSSRTAGDGDAVQASLALRIAPAARKAFQAMLETSTGEAGGKLLESSVDGEDITRQIIDAEAALKAKRTLRDRLQTLLENREGRLADLLAVEKALSETQQELDAATALAAELRQRISFSKMTINYRSETSIGSNARPLADALANAEQILSESLAAMVMVAVAMVPWLIIVAVIVVVIRTVRRRRRAAAARASPQAPL